MKKILPIKYPPITTYLSHGYNLSALMNYEEFLPWFYTNYIHLKCLKELTQELVCDLNFYFPDGLDYLQRIPFVKSQLLYKDIMSVLGCNIVSFLKDAISEGYYICTFVDEYYIPGKYIYQKKNNSHRILIYGFDDDLNIFNACGWENQVFRIDEIVSYNDFSAAFESDHNKDILLSNRGTLCFKIENNFYNVHQYKLDIGYIYQALNEYLFSKNTSENFGVYSNKLDSTKYSFGMNAYNEFINYLHKLVDKQANPSHIAVNIIWEHKKCMLLRINYLKEMGYITNNIVVNSYKEVEKKAQICRNLMLKYLMLKDNSQINKMINLIGIIKSEEWNLLVSLLEDIKHTNSI